MLKKIPLFSYNGGSVRGGKDWGREAKYEETQDFRRETKGKQRVQKGKRVPKPPQDDSAVYSCAIVSFEN